MRQIKVLSWFTDCLEAGGHVSVVDEYCGKVGILLKGRQKDNWSEADDDGLLEELAELWLRMSEYEVAEANDRIKSMIG
jgi:hypothetical protein